MSKMPDNVTDTNQPQPTGENKAPVPADQQDTAIYQRFEAALSAGNVATWTIDLVNDRVTGDAQLAYYFSVDEDAAHNGTESLQTYMDRIHPQDRAHAERAITEAIQNRTSYSVEIRLVLRDGSAIWVNSRGTIARDANEQPISMFGAIIDITERVERDRRNWFLYALEERTRRITDPQELIEDAVHSLGEFLGISRCVFYEIDPAADTVMVSAEYCSEDSMPGLAGAVLPMSSFGEPLLAALLAGRPIILDDILVKNEFIPPAFLPAYTALNIRALVTVPALHSDRLVFGLGVHHATPRVWTPREIELMQNVLERTWLRVEVDRQQQATAEETEKRRAATERENARMESIFMCAPAFMAALRGPEHIYELANQPYYELIGKQDLFAAHGIIGKSVAQVIPEMVEQGFVALLDHVYRTGEAHTGVDMRVVFPSRTDSEPSEHFIDFAFQPLYEEDGAVSGVLVHGVDLTDRKRLEEELARALHEQRSRALHEAILNQISEAIRGIVEPDTILQTIVPLLGRALGADRCYFVRYDQERDIARVSQEWYRSSIGIEPLGDRFVQMSHYSVDRDPRYKAGGTHVVDDVTKFDPENAAPLLALKVRSLLRIPIKAGNQMTALGVAMAKHPRHWTADEIRLVENVAALARTSLDAAYIQQRERNIALQLQEALQPAVVQDLPTLALASYYRPALAEASIGGDFYDVFPLRDGYTALVVGDLSGKGLAAASQVATVRNMLRYALYSNSELAASIANLHRTIIERELLHGFATLFVGIYDEARKTMNYINCGQEPGLVYRAATGAIDFILPSGSVLGGFGAGSFEEESIAFATGDIIALFTDGLTEVGPSRKEQLEISGVGRLFHDCCQQIRTEAHLPTQEPEAVADCLIECIDAYARGGVRDDIALLIGVVRD